MHAKHESTMWRCFKVPAKHVHETSKSVCIPSAKTSDVQLESDAE